MRFAGLVLQVSLFRECIAQKRFNPFFRFAFFSRVAGHVTISGFQVKLVVRVIVHFASSQFLSVFPVFRVN
jgi:hypothetical protein